MNKGSCRQIASKLMVVTGSALVLVNILGLAIGTSVVEKNYEYSNDLVPGHSYPVQDTLKLQEMLRESMTTFDLEDVNDTIFESIIHSDKMKIHLFDNWLLWLGGRFYEPLSRTQNPRRIISGGGGLCSEVSAVLNSIARLNGFETRYIVLNGHVVSEIRTEYGWRVADPDYGVTYPVGLETLEKNDGAPLMRQLLRNRGYDENTIDLYIQQFQSSEDNMVTDVDVALSPRLNTIELASEWLKWIIPTLIIILGAVARKTQNVVSNRSSFLQY
jgi:hypothetical protein